MRRTGGEQNARAPTAASVHAVAWVALAAFAGCDTGTLAAPDFANGEIPDAEVADARVPDARVPDAQVPDARVPDARAPDARAPDARAPDAEFADAEVADAEVADTEVADTEVADTEVADTEVADAEVADAAFEAGVLDAEVLDAQAPDAASPVDAQLADGAPPIDAHVPDAAPPVDAQLVDAAVPDAAGLADAQIPDAAPLVDAQVVDAAPLVDAQVPDAQAPDAAPPIDAQVADAALPDERVLHVYVAGESIEAFNHFDETPFNDDGTLRAPDDNTERQYGWMVPLGDRLHLRAPDLSIEWVGADRWMNHNTLPSDGRHPATAAARTSAIPGTTVVGWLELRSDELVNRVHCYDVAFAARGGNDLNQEIDAGTYSADLRVLIRLLGAGSSCAEHPLIYVTAHMPDANAWNRSPDPVSVQAWVDRQRQQYVGAAQAAIDALDGEDGLRVRFIDMYTPFMENRPTTAFPAPRWTVNGGPDLVRMHLDGAHPMRLASIYAGEVVADALALEELRR